MNNRELIYPEFERMFLADDTKALKAALDSSRDQFIFKDILYTKLIQTCDKDKIKRYINTQIFDKETEIYLIIEAFDEDEVPQVLLENIDIIKNNMDIIFYTEQRIDAVELVSKAINKDEEVIDNLLEIIAKFNIDGNRKNKVVNNIRQILNNIGKEKIKDILGRTVKVKIIKNLLLILDDIDFIKECFFDEELNIFDIVKMEILRELGEKAKPIYQECLKNYEMFEPGFILDCLTEIRDKDITLKYLCNDEIEISDEDKIQSILEYDSEFIKRCIKDENLRLETIGKVILICNLGDKKYAEECIIDEGLALNEEDVIFLKSFFEIGLDDYIDKIKNEMVMLKTSKNSTKGIEIESGGGLDGYVIDAINTDEVLAEEITGDQKWKYNKDGSGIELSSYVMTDDEQATKSIYYICHLLKQQRQQVTDMDAGHVNIGTNILTHVQSYKNLLTMWYNLERAIFLISNQEGELPRDNTIVGEEYAKTTSLRINEMILNKILEFKVDETISSFIEKLRHEFDKFFSINLGHTNSSKGCRIEYRTPNGTLDPKVWIENINFFANFTQSAEDLYQIQIKDSEERIEDEKIKLELFDKIKAKDVSEKEKVEALLGIVFQDEEQRDIYRKRYSGNVKVLQQKSNKNLKQAFDVLTADYFIGFDAEEIGEQCFSESDIEIESMARDRLKRDRVAEKSNQK